jgi:phosphatidylglycerol:prolipoprotein diacylglycerol transferase
MTAPSSDATPLLVALPFPDISPSLFSIGAFELRWYALAYLVGILLGWILIRRVTSAPDDPVGRLPLDDLVNFSIIGIILGGRLVYVFFYNAEYYLANPIDIFKVWEGGMAFHGGFLGVVAAVIFTAFKHKVEIIRLGDLAAMVSPIGLFFGRLANFINGELYGRVTDVPWAVIFPNGGGLPRHPSQIYEALLEGVLLFIIMMLACHMGARRKPGLMIGLFLTGYGMARIFVENFREPDSQIGFLFGGITMGQMLSLPMVLIGFVLINHCLESSDRA